MAWIDNNTIGVFHFDKNNFWGCDTYKKVTITKDSEDTSGAEINEDSKFGSSCLNSVATRSPGFSVKVTDEDLKANSTWTIDWWDNLANSQSPVKPILMMIGDPELTATIGVQIYIGNLQDSDKIFCNIGSDGSSWNILNGVNTGFTGRDAWHHRAVVYNGSEIRFYQDGVKVSTHSAVIPPEIPFVFRLNGNPSSIMDAKKFPGKIDELRISLGELYTDNFTPETAPYRKKIVYGRKISAGGGGSAPEPAVETVTVTNESTAQPSVILLSSDGKTQYSYAMSRGDTKTSVVKGCLVGFTTGSVPTYFPTKNMESIGEDTVNSCKIYKINGDVTFSR